ncbi:hypothetical protein NQZ68_002997 [Dissostichus eleginoides]|nr:hypothetical protein NQZ68_002997 [Dissostichus eleginoides]
MAEAIATRGIAAPREMGRKGERGGKSSIMEKGAPVCCSANKESGSLPPEFVNYQIVTVLAVRKQTGDLKLSQKVDGITLDLPYETKSHTLRSPDSNTQTALAARLKADRMAGPGWKCSLSTAGGEQASAMPFVYLKADLLAD